MPESPKLRLFTAVFPPEDVVAQLQTFMEGARKRVSSHGIRWSEPEQIHLTLNFLGTRPAEKLPAIEAALEAGCAGQHQHTVRVTGLGCFPNPNRPRILWAGLAGNLNPLEKLKKAMDNALGPCGYVAEDRPFKPHLTVARIMELRGGERRELMEMIATAKDRSFGDWQIGRVDLMQSTLRPQGATYRVLRSVTLP